FWVLVSYLSLANRSRPFWVLVSYLSLANRSRP
ncbi:hypothetical protein LSAT2_020266, partial [Lamellibrachia satsuma]